MMVQEWKLVEEFAQWKPFMGEKRNAVLANLKIGSNLVEKVFLEQSQALKLQMMLEAANKGNSELRVAFEGGIRFQNMLWVPKDSDVKGEILKEAHRSLYNIHPGTTKMFKDLQRNFWWKGMKKDIAEFVSWCLVYQQIKVEHQRPAGMLQTIEIPEWKCVIFEFF